MNCCTCTQGTYKQDYSCENHTETVLKTYILYTSNGYILDGTVIMLSWNEKWYQYCYYYYH